MEIGIFYGSLVRAEHHDQFTVHDSPVFGFQLDQLLRLEQANGHKGVKTFVHPTRFFIDNCVTMRQADLEGVEFKGSWKKYPGGTGPNYLELFADQEIHFFPIEIEHHLSCFVIHTPKSKRKKARFLTVEHIDMDSNTGHQRTKVFTFLRQILIIAMTGKNDDFVKLLNKVQRSNVMRLSPRVKPYRDLNAGLYIAQIYRSILQNDDWYRMLGTFPGDRMTAYEAHECNFMRHRLILAIESTPSTDEYDTVLSDNFKVTRVLDLTAEND